MSAMAKVTPLRDRNAPGPMSDEAIAAACGTRDPAAIAELFTRFEPQVTRFLRRSVSRPGDVEDLVQATFLAIAEGKAHFRGESSVRSWLLGIAANKVRAHRRSVGRRRNLERGFASVRQLFGLGRSAPGEGATAARLELGRAEAALRGLPEEQGMAFILCEIEGLSAREAGEVLGAAEATIWKRVSRARQSLKAALGAAEASDDRGGEGR